MALDRSPTRVGLLLFLDGIGSELRRLPWIPIIVLGTFVFVAVFANWIAPFDPNGMALPNRLKPPGFESADGLHLLGTDHLGRDLLSRLFYGARTSLIVAIFGLLVGGGLGLAIGIVAGYVGGRIDAFLMRMTDAFMALPTLFIALVFVMTVGPGLLTIILALSLVVWSRFARIIRSEVLLLKERDYVQLAKVANCSMRRIMIVHILPNVLNTFIVLCSLEVSQIILTEATLSFLGAGIPQPTATWGNMVAGGKDYLVNAWWIGLFPGLALTLVVFSFNTFGDWLRIRFDPRLRQL
jgi:peptide/nickel transport system permease protein